MLNSWALEEHVITQEKVGLENAYSERKNIQEQAAGV